MRDHYHLFCVCVCVCVDCWPLCHQLHGTFCLTPFPLSPYWPLSWTRTVPGCGQTWGKCRTWFGVGQTEERGWDWLPAASVTCEIWGVGSLVKHLLNHFSNTMLVLVLCDIEQSHQVQIWMAETVPHPKETVTLKNRIILYTPEDNIASL